jgi:hypothetical protein
MNIYKLLLPVGLFAMSFGALAQNIFAKGIDEEMVRLQGLRSTTAADRDADLACKKRYKKIFNKEVVKISYGMGYGDGSPGSIVWDHFVYQGLVSRLKMMCPYGVNVCGFAESKKEKNLFTKVVPDPTGEKYNLIELRITKASLSSNNTVNTSPEYLARQTQACADANTKFFGEIANGADIAFYYGHSRDGGGPDFCPPITLSNGHVNYPYYRKAQPGFKKLLGAMETGKKNQKTNQVIGLFSCSSQLHFYKGLMNVNSSAGYILTGRTANFEELSMDAYASLDNLLSQRCADGFDESFAERRATKTLNMF